jgi:1,4-dihydroxy-2-naphthoyl-CoA hydrolase
MPFTYDRAVHFRDTDAAGVVYFANVLAMCHEAYEASLAATGINVQKFFSRRATAVPITHAHVDFLRPMKMGDRLQIHLTPNRLSASEFEIAYQIVAATAPERVLSRAVTRHVHIHVAERSRQDLPDSLVAWLTTWE